RLQVTGYRLQVTGYRLQVTGYRLQVTGYRLQGTGNREQVTGNRLQVTGKKDRIDTYGVLYGYATQAIKNQIGVLYMLYICYIYVFKNFTSKTIS
ncbi:MAG: hypothetical protein AN487_04605, partial [Anabaena sp. CRKS33]